MLVYSFFQDKPFSYLLTSYLQINLDRLQASLQDNLRCVFSNLTLYLFVSLNICLLNNSVWAAEPDTTPLLCIEPGLHMAQIKRIAVDKAERYVVSAADDKTARVWDATTGELLQILRPPIALGDDGMLYAVAISSQGEQIAVAGWTGYEWDRTNSIYLFNRATGKIQGRIQGLPNVINHLAYTPDGKVLAASLGSNGIRFYAVVDKKKANDKDSYQEVARDTDYADASYSIDFDQQGRIVTTSDDGYIRLYDSDFNKLMQQKAPGGKEPFYARFSPDGKRIAVGFADSTAINLLSADDLTLLESPETKDFTRDLSSVAWSKDGHWLYAGGRYNNGKGFPVIAWQTDSLTSHHVYHAAQGTLMDIQPLTDGGLLFASADSALGRLNAEGKPIWKQGAGALDYRGYTSRRAFSLSDNALTVGFHYQYENEHGEVQKKIARWDVSNLAFENEAVFKDLNQPRLKAPKLDIQDWENQYHPSLNDTALPLQDYERSRSLAISTKADQQQPSFVLGTNWEIRLFNHKGKQQWQQPVPIAWAVNISADNRYVVAALGDGTIRWYQVEDGKERLAFYLHPEAIDSNNKNPRWIAWTPDGFYATSSIEAESLMGFHINQGADKAARFVDAGQLREVFAREDLVAQALDTSYPELANKALERAGDLKKILAAGAAPQINLQGKSSFTIKQSILELDFTLEDLGGGIGKREYRVDGKLVSSGDSRGSFAPRSAGGQESIKRKFSLSQGEHTISIRAFDKAGLVASKPVEIKVTVDDPVHREPSLYVLSVGVSQYRDSSFSLEYAADDAIDFAATLKKQGRKLYKSVVTKTLVDKEATLTEINAAFEDMARKAQPQDVFVFYLAGHGTVSDGRYHFIPHDLIYANEDSLKDALTEAKLKELLASVETGKRMMVIDSCHAGQALQVLASLSPHLANKSRSMKDKTAIGRLMKSTGIAILAASSKEQEAKEGIIENGEGHGVFTHVLLKGLRGAADGRMKKDGQIDIEELISYTRTEVPRISLEKWQYEQFPMYQAPKQNFPITLIRQ